MEIGAREIFQKLKINPNQKGALNQDVRFEVHSITES